MTDEWDGEALSSQIIPGVRWNTSSSKKSEDGGAGGGGMK